jgi:hypothetical protein
MHETPVKKYSARTVSQMGADQTKKSVPMGGYSNPTPKFSAPMPMAKKSAPSFKTNK